MKKVKIVLVLLATLCFFVGCLSNKENSDYYKTVEATVLAETTMIKCCWPDPIDREAMIVKVKDGGTRHLLMGEIKGFTYEKGYEYQLLIQEKHLADPPQDGGNVEYSLVKQISKNRK